jgi:hypothetical protein
MPRTTTVGAALTALLMLGCEPVKPRPASAPPPPEQPRASKQSDGGIMQIPDGGSQSALGKSRDAAVRTKQKIDAYQEEVSRQADEVFKNP